jgi:diguanylate cyclase (GGDEF)-like protein
VRTVTYRARRKDGAYVWMETTVKTVPPAPPEETAELIAVWRDISERKRMEEQLAHDATHDALTGLPNRELFVDRLGRALQRARRVKDYRFALLYLDLDRFKVVNDSLGHLMGDQLLLAIAERLQSELRSMDTVTRLGGDEFAILIEQVRDAAEAIKAAERVQAAFARPFEVGGREAFASASIGVAVGDGSYGDPADLLRDADTAMYRAKEAGRARHAVFDSGMHATAMARLDLETDLRRAADRGELRLVYQPILSLQDGAVVGFEALARWHHPQRGLVLPTDFIPLAEETGFIGPIGAWVLGEACRQAHAWRDLVSGGRPVWVSVNLSGKQVMQPELAGIVEHELREAGLARGRLMVEITESVVIADPEAAVATLRQLENLGVRLCVDDFGTGYSSLSYLHRFPVEVLKIDRSFVGRMDAEKESEELVRSIIALARTLGLAVVAEGVETQRQLDALGAHGCDYAQGYLFSPPLEAAAAEAWFTRQAGWASRRPISSR